MRGPCVWGESAMGGWEPSKVSWWGPEDIWYSSWASMGMGRVRISRVFTNLCPHGGSSGHGLLCNVIFVVNDRGMEIHRGTRQEYLIYGYEYGLHYLNPQQIHTPHEGTMGCGGLPTGLHRYTCHIWLNLRVVNYHIWTLWSSLKSPGCSMVTHMLPWCRQVVKADKGKHLKV